MDHGSTQRLDLPAAAAPAVLPRRAVVVGLGALAATVAGVAWLRASGFDAGEPDAPVLRERRLHFRDLPDGGVAIVDARSGGRLETVHGEQGFLRGTLRGMARERRRRDVPEDAPLRLIGRTDGRLTLLDDLTGRRIDLESFGPTNAAVFARWLDMPVPAQPVAETPTHSQVKP